MTTMNIWKRSTMLLILAGLAWFSAGTEAVAQRQPRQPGTPGSSTGGTPPRPSGPSQDELRRKQRQQRANNTNGNGNAAQGNQNGQPGAAELSPEVTKAALKAFDGWKKSQVMQRDMVTKGQWSGIDKSGKKHDVDFELQWRKDTAGWNVVFLQTRTGDLPPAASLGTGPVPWTFNWYGYLPEEKKLTGPKAELPKVFTDDGVQIADLLPLDLDIYDSVIAQEESEVDKVPVYIFELKTKRAGITAEPLRLTLKKDGRDALKVEWMKDDEATKTLTYSDFTTIGVHRIPMTRVIMMNESHRATRLKWKSPKVNVGLEAAAFDPKNLAAFVTPKDEPAAPKK